MKKLVIDRKMKFLEWSLLWWYFKVQGGPFYFYAVVSVNLIQLDALKCTHLFEPNLQLPASYTRYIKTNLL